MDESKATGNAGDVSTDTAIEERITALLRWAEGELDLLASAFRGCTERELEEVRQALGVDRLPRAYATFLGRMGGGGVGSALAEIFPGDDVAIDSILPGDGWPGMREVAQEVLHAHGLDRELAPDEIVIRTYRADEVEWITTEGDDPPVFALGGADPSMPAHDSFTSWLEHRIGRAIKRRYPLRNAHLPVADPLGAPAAADAGEAGDDWFAVVVGDEAVEEIIEPPGTLPPDDDGEDWFAGLVPEDAVEEIIGPPGTPLPDDDGEDWFADFLREEALEDEG